MSTPLLATKLYIPSPRPKVVFRARLIARLNEGLHRKLTLISAAAGFGKTTLLSEWIADCGRPTAWLSLDEGDNDPTRFLTYLVAALQTIAANIGEGILGAIRSPQPPTAETILTALINDITTIPHNFILVIDDYHILDSKPIDNAIAFLLEYLPPQMHLVIASREDPHLPLARLRGRGQLTELRATDLRFTPSEAAGFLNEVMGLNLTVEDIAALETRTEGWIAGLQLAALSMQGHQDAHRFIKSFTGSHHFVLDYLIEEVLKQQPESIQIFLVRTSILDRLCGPLCDAVLLTSAGFGQETLHYIEHANLFIVPLDNERRWYRYHHLFGDLLRQRLQQSIASSPQHEDSVAELHIRASEWYEANDLELEAFHHAVAAQDIDRAERLMEGRGMPLQFRGAVAPVLNWLAALPASVLEARPSLLATYASVSLATGQTVGIEQKLQAAESALQDTQLDEKARDTIGRIAATRATLAVSRHDIETVISESQRALEYLHPDNLPFRTSTIWKLGYAYQFQGNRPAATRAYTEAISLCQASGNVMFNTLARTGLGNVQETENQLPLAVDTYQRVLQLVADNVAMPAAACETNLGLARIFYEWNKLELAEQYGQKSLKIAAQLQNTDRTAVSEIFLAKVKLAQKDDAGAAAYLSKAAQYVKHNFMYRMPDVAAAQVLALLQQGQVEAAALLTQEYDLPVSRARISLAQADPSAALTILEPLRAQMEARNWKDERLKIMVLQALAHHARGEKGKALQIISEALTVAEPGGFIRLFVDEGPPMAQLLYEAASQGMMPGYISQLLAVFDAEKPGPTASPIPSSASQALIDPLSERELEVLRLIAQGLSNHEISERLFLALSTVKGHNRIIFDKLQVQRRTEAVARARELGLL